MSANLFMRDATAMGDAVKRAVSYVTGASIEDLEGVRRTDFLARARWIAMLILRKQEITLVEVGNLFNRNHASVIHAEKRARRLIETSPEFRSAYEQVAGLLRDPRKGSDYREE